MGERSRRAFRAYKRQEALDPAIIYDVDEANERNGWPQEWACMNVMCRRKFWREFGESEFCPSCRKCLPGGRKCVGGRR
jgi:hypothetical protein